jgi:predicted ATPase
MITELNIQHYGCIEDLTLPLTPLHALVGPNESGKSTILRALHNMAHTIRTRKRISDPYVGTRESPSMLSSKATEGDVTSTIWPEGGSVQWKGHNETTHFPTALIRWDPDRLKEASQLITQGQQLEFLTQRGKGLPGIYDWILSNNDGAFAKISEQFVTYFPSVKRLRLHIVDNTQKVLGAELKNGKKITANQMSEGMLYFLAFAALQQLEPIKLLLIEEPENGLHPIRIAEVVRILRELTKSGTQVIISTHSPLVLNELAPEEVTVLWRKDGGPTQGRLMRDTFNFKARHEVLTLGEMWLNYCNGVDEEMLVFGPEPE